MDGVVDSGEGLVWPGGGVLPCVEPASICVWVVGMAQISGAAPVVGQRCVIQSNRQSMDRPRWYLGSPEMIWARARIGVA